MANENKTVFGTFTEAVGIYLQHLPTFLKYMTFPVLGQFFGVVLSLALPLCFVFNFADSYTFTLRLPFWLAFIVKLLPNSNIAYIITLLLCVPGLVIFAKAFWEYLIAYVAISSMAENTVKSGKIYDINAHKQVALKRVPDFVGLWLLFGVFTSVALLPPMWGFGAVIFIFLVLIFQVFTFEKFATPTECFKRSWVLVKSDFWGTLGLLALVGFLTYWLLPKVFELILTAIQVMTLLTMLIDPMLTDSINTWNTALTTLGVPFVITSLMITKMIVGTIVSTLVICYTLPIRSIAWTLWYKKLNTAMIKASSKKKKKADKKENV